METRIKRDYKNSVFIDMFERDDYRLQMFQTFHPEMTDVQASDITAITLKQVITNHQYNDLAFLVKDRLMVFVEAQSTWSINILVRTLLYLADTIQEYIHVRGFDIHDTKKLPLPTPEFYIVYTGKQPVPETISLKDDFFANSSCSIDLRARVITAESMDIVGQYIIFSHVLDDQIRRLGRTRQAIEEAIRICRDRGVLLNYLQEQEKEVIDIMVMLFDQEYAVERYAQAQAREAREEGRVQGREEGREEGLTLGREEGLTLGLEKGYEAGRTDVALQLLKERLPLSFITGVCNLSEDTVRELADSHGIALA